MQELRQLLKEYEEKLKEATTKLSAQNFPSIDLDKDILGQINNQILSFFKNLIPKLNLTSEEVKEIEDALDFYNKNADLDLNLLIVRDKKIENFIEVIKNLYQKIETYQDMINKEYQKIIEENQRLIAIIKDIFKDLKSDEEIDIDKLIEKIRQLPLSLETIILILREANLKNLKKYQHDLKSIKEQKEVKKEDKEEKEINEVIDDQIELDHSTLKKCQSLMKKINEALKKDLSQDAQKYLIQSKLVILEDELNFLYSESSEWTNLKEQKDSKEVLKDYIISINSRIQVLYERLIELQEEYQNTKEKEESDIESKEENRDIIFLNPVFEDLEEFTWGKCSPAISKKLANLLMRLKNGQIGSPIRSKNFDSLKYPINKLKIGSSGGTPRVFYQIVENQIIVLHLGIEGRVDYNVFNAKLDARIGNNQEYKMLLTALLDAKKSPSMPSKYDSSISNSEFLARLLAEYKKVEKEFWSKMESECYQPNSQERQVG